MKLRSIVAGFAVLPLAIGMFAQALAQSPPPAEFGAAGEFLKTHCNACHGPDKQESQLRLDRIGAFRAEDSHLWTAIHEKLSAGEMPPKDRPRPDPAEQRRFLAWIESRQRATAVHGARRLNRRELAAALRDVTGLPVDYANSLPGDGKVAGFDTGAEGLHDSADSVAQAMRTTQQAVDGIRFLEPSPGIVFAADLRQAKDPKKALDDWKTLGATVKDKGSGLLGQGLLVQPTWVGDRGGFSFSVPAPPGRAGALRLKLAVSAFKPYPTTPNPRLWVEVGGKDVDYGEITGTLNEPQTLEYIVQVDELGFDAKGVSVSLANKVELPYAVEGFENDERGSPDKPIPGGTGLWRPAYQKLKLPLDKQPVPHVVLQRIEVETNFVAAWPPATLQADAAELSDNAATAKRLLNLWTDRAWRRPTTAAERERFMTLYEQFRDHGLSFDVALRGAFQSALMSAPFRYLSSPALENAALSHYAVASRLSFFLTGAPPDDELRRLAAAAKLRDPATLDAQVDRLLAQPASDAFVRPFVTQWLEADQPITVAMSHLEKQDFRFGRYLKASMRDETTSYFARLIADNRPAKELVESDWTMMNDILAWHYGYEGIEGGELRKVTLRANDPRGGGLLGHAGIQSMLCWMGDNWVIYRGAWALRHILDRPPPSPPLEVPELVPSDAENKGKSFRELLRQHQEDGRCAVCHKQIDPLGFAFQNFDLSGRWRDVEHESYARSELDGKIAWAGEGATRPVDSAGRMPRGEEFADFAEFKSLLANDYQVDLVRGLLKNLTIYAAGRKPNVDDLAEIAKIMNELQPKGYPMRELVKSLVRSRIFLDQAASAPASALKANAGANRPGSPIVSRSSP